MATPLTYATLEAMLLSTLAEAPPPFTGVPPDFAQQYPQAIAYTENLFYSAAIFLATRTEDRTSLSVAPGVRTLALAGMTPNVVVVQESFGLVTPTGSPASTGTVAWFTKTSLDFIDRWWPQASATYAPAGLSASERFWAPLDNNVIVYAPTADAVYQAVVGGLFQPAPLSATTTSTYLSTVYPALLFAGCMEFLSGALQKNYSAQSDDPRQALSWKAQRDELLTVAVNEEMRRRGLMPDMPQPATPAAPAPR